MKAFVSTVVLAITMSFVCADAQTASEAHVAAAKAAAGADFAGVFNRICSEAVPSPARPLTTPLSSGTPARKGRGRPNGTRFGY